MGKTIVVGGGSEGTGARAGAGGGGGGGVGRWGGRGGGSGVSGGGGGGGGDGGGGGGGREWRAGAAVRGAGGGAAWGQVSPSVGGSISSCLTHPASHLHCVHISRVCLTPIHVHKHSTSPSLLPTPKKTKPNKHKNRVLPLKAMLNMGLDTVRTRFVLPLDPSKLGAYATHTFSLSPFGLIVGPCLLFFHISCTSAASNAPPLSMHVHPSI